MFHSATESLANGQSIHVKKKYSRERNNTNKMGTSFGPKHSKADDKS